jgi:hypothetical protein
MEKQKIDKFFKELCGEIIKKKKNLNFLTEVV